MKLPIKGRTYKVIVDTLSPGIAGLCDPINKVIYIDSEVNLMDTLLHEIGHAYIHEVALDQVMTPEIQEIVVENFAQVLTDLFDIKLKKAYLKKKKKRAKKPCTTPSIS
tara:strand:+ start:176 stop:502 length:327 start_codon:yes stop_codon:yes gene_type:complete